MFSSTRRPWSVHETSISGWGERIRISYTARMRHAVRHEQYGSTKRHGITYRLTCITAACPDAHLLAVRGRFSRQRGKCRHVSGNAAVARVLPKASEPPINRERAESGLRGPSGTPSTVAKNPCCLDLLG
jgi:hypothetical protein